MMLVDHVIASFHKTTTGYVRGAGIERSCLTAAAAQREVADRRGWARVLRLDFHGLGRRCHQYSQDTHCHLLWFFSKFLQEHEGITTPSPLPGQAALRGESGCSSRKALPRKSRAEVFDAIHDTLLDDDGRRSVVIIAAGLGCGGTRLRDTW